MKKQIFAIALSTLCIQVNALEIDTVSAVSDTTEAYSENDMAIADTAAYEEEYSEGEDVLDTSFVDDSLYAEESDGEEPKKTGYSTFRMSLGGSYYDLTNLNNVLTSNELPIMDNAAVQFGFGRTTQKTRIVKDYGILINSWRNAINPSRKSDLTAVAFSLTYGFDLIKPTHVSLFPFVGADLGTLILKTSYKKLPFNSVITGGSPEDEILHRITLTAQTGLGFDIRKNREGFMPSIGFRAGYQFDLLDATKWYRGMSTISDGPSTSLSGPFAKLVFGIALPK